MIRTDEKSRNELLAVVVAPWGRDAELICRTLGEAAIGSVPYYDLRDAEGYVESGCGVMLIAEEALDSSRLQLLTTALRKQPAWSELPLIILTVGGQSTAYSEHMERLRKPLGTALVLERPVRRETLVAAVESSLQARKRQYELRDQIAALEQSEEQFRAFADSMSNLAWITAPDGSIFWYNRRWHEYTGTTPEEMQEYGWERFHDPAELPRVKAEWQAVLREKRPLQIEFPLRGADGLYRWFLTRAVPVRSASGEVTRWIGTNTDVDELRRTQMALHESRQRLNAAMAASRTGTFRWDPRTGTFSEFDENLKGLFGFKRGEAVTRTEDFLARIHPDDRDAVVAGVQRCREGADFDMEYRVVLPDGSIRWLYDRGRMATDYDEGPPYLVGACTDVTERRGAEESLRRSEKLAATGRLAATVAHEINNPLEAVTNLLYLARNHQGLDDTVRKYLAMADQELTRVTQVTKQTLGFYRESNQPSQIDPCALMDNVLLLYEGRLRNKGITVLKDYKEIARLSGIEGELRQVISNVLANAIDASNRAGKIRVTVAPCENGDGRKWAMWEIADNGPGIAEEHLSHIFEPFFTTKREIGTGLGLWVSRDLMTKQGGDIEIRTSTEPGRSGTGVRVRMPVHVTSPPQDAEGEPPKNTA